MTPGEPLQPDQPASPRLEDNPGGNKPRRWRITPVLILLGLITLAVYGILSRQASNRKLKAEALASDVEMVSVTTPQKAPAVVTLDLPGQTEAFTQAPIYA